VEGGLVGANGKVSGGKETESMWTQRPTDRTNNETKNSTDETSPATRITRNPPNNQTALTKAFSSEDAGEAKKSVR